MEILNYTRNTITVWNIKEGAVELPSVGVAQCDYKELECTPHLGDVVTIKKAIRGVMIPDPVKGVYLVVEPQIAALLPKRHDLLTIVEETANGPLQILVLTYDWTSH